MVPNITLNALPVPEAGGFSAVYVGLCFHYPGQAFAKPVLFFFII